MRRFIILLLLCVLPLQFVLAANIDAHMHAGSDHQHDATSYSHEMTATPGIDNADESSPRSHGECSACHFYHSVAMLGTSADFKRPMEAASATPTSRDTQYRNAATERPERPNWSVLV